MTASIASLAWFARHEFRLAWRDWLAMMTGGKRVRGIIAFSALALFMVALHWVAGVLIEPWLETGIVLDKPTLVNFTGGGLLFVSVMLSQAMESVTRAYYTRSDLDLILSSPASAPQLFAIRTGAIVFATVALSCLLASPIIDMLVLADGPHWLAAYIVLVALGALCATVALLITVGLFRLVGPQRTRLISQIIAAIIGAGFIIGIQAVAIVGYGSMSRFAVLQSHDVIALAPGLDSPLWYPARAALGEPFPLLVVMIVGFGALLLAILATASSFGRHAIAATSIARTRTVPRHERQVNFRAASPRQVLRRKEWKLLQRDPWLLSQTLMQVLYLLPPALMLWINFGHEAGAFVVAVPVLVMASGQLAGGLAWLAISGEDAHDLVATAPLSRGSVLTAKIEAVLAVIAVVLAPLLILVALSSPRMVLITAIGATLAASSSTTVQLLFRVQARRSMFRRRQVSSRTATILEALVSIAWAGTGALLAASSPLAVIPAIAAFLVLLLAWIISPKKT
ncbi:MAG TPA: permease [Devosiaceae bacterium]|jgi:ABC-2 type transport system permease protein